MVYGSPNNWAFVLYNAADWHQRLVLREVAFADWTSSRSFDVVNPDGDLYIEDFAGRKGDVAAVRFSSTFRTLPGGIARDKVYRFREDLSASVMADALQQAELAAAEWWGLHSTGPPEIAHLLVPIVAPSFAVATPPAKAKTDSGRKNQQWVFAENHGGQSRGGAHTLLPSDSVHGDVWESPRRPEESACVYATPAPPLLPTTPPSSQRMTIVFSPSFCFRMVVVQVEPRAYSDWPIGGLRINSFC